MKWKSLSSTKHCGQVDAYSGVFNHLALVPEPQTVGRYQDAHALGAAGSVGGDVVFYTRMARYVEALTDPSYCASGDAIKAVLSTTGIICAASSESFGECRLRRARKRSPKLCDDEMHPLDTSA